MQESLSGEREVPQASNGRFTEKDFSVLVLNRPDGRCLTSLVILRPEKAFNLTFEQQAEKLPQGFRPVSQAEIEAFVDQFRRQRGGHYPRVDHTFIWTSTIQGDNRIAVFIDRTCRMITVSPQSPEVTSAYTGTPILITATKE